MAIYKLGDRSPRIHPTAFVAESADIIGDVVIGAHASIWFNVTIRAEHEQIVIGEHTNIQDGSVLHADPGFPLLIGKNVTVGHMAMLHGCKIGDGALVGIRATVLDGSVIGDGALVGAGALVTENKSFQNNAVLMGVPARVIRTMDDAAVTEMMGTAHFYAKNGTFFQEKLEKIENTKSD